MKGKISVVNIDFLNGSDEQELVKVKAALERQRKDQIEAGRMAQLDDLIHKLGNMAYRDIVEITSRTQAPLAVFLLCTCLLEQMATYRYSRNGNIRKFVKDYLPQYDADVMHEMRNRINHNYSLHEKYALTMGARNAHLNPNTDGVIVINIENFVEELGIAFSKFSDDLRKNKEIRNNALTVMQNYGILSQASMDILIPSSTDDTKSK